MSATKVYESPARALAGIVTDGMSVAVGGFGLCGIPEQLWVAADALTTNADCRILAIGNPDNPASHFRRVCTPGSVWHQMAISAFDSPNLTGEEIPADMAAADAMAAAVTVEVDGSNPSRINVEFTDYMVMGARVFAVKRNWALGAA